jgi:hypothetical protein
MPAEPQISLLPYHKRQRFFWFLVGVFTLAFPALLFYSSGYRIAFDDEVTSIISTGGLYVNTLEQAVDVYLNEEQVDNPRLFMSAYYIQNINAGMHRLVVQGEGLQTWVKELPVDESFVTEASAFTLPQVPQVRPVTAFVTATGTPIVIASSTDPLAGVSSTVPYQCRVASSGK